MNAKKSLDMNDLLKLSTINFKHKVPEDVGARLPRMKIEAKLAKDRGEIEKAFILLKRWLNTVEWMKTTRQYKKDKHRYDTIFYMNQEPDIRALFVDVERKLVARFAPEEVTQEIDDKLNGDNRVGAEEVLKLPETPTDEPLENETREFISCFQLFKMIKQSAKILMIDVRSDKDYQASRIKNDLCINIPADVIKPGVWAPSFEKLFVHDKTSLRLYERRSSTFVDIVVLLDWRTTSTTLFPDNKMKVLRDILTLWDRGMRTPKIMILDGGFVEWLNRYPNSSTNPKIETPLANPPIMDELLLEDFEYPDFLNTEGNASPFGSLRIQASDKNVGKSKRNNENRSDNDDFTNRSVNEEKSLPIMGNTISNRNDRTNLSKNMLNDNDIDMISNPYKTASKKMNELSKYVRKIDSNENEHMNVDEDEDEDDEIIFESQKIPGQSIRQNTTSKPRIDRSSKPSITLNNQYTDVEPLLTLKRQLCELMTNEEHIANKLLLSETEYYGQNEQDNVDPSENVKLHRINLKERLLSLNSTMMQLENERDLVERVLCEQSLHLQKMPMNSNDERQSAILDREIDAIKKRLSNISFERESLKHKRQNPVKSKKVPASKKNENITREPLKSDGSSVNSGLKRSHSSPNLAQLDEVKIPLVDRSSKPHNRIADFPNRARTGFSSRLTWKDREDRMEPIFRHGRPGITGLKNLGNSCYMNSIIQCLSNNIRLAKYFNEDAYLDNLSRSIDHSKQGLVADEVAHVVKALWRGQYKSISPRDLKVAIGQYRLQFDSNDQQDSHEFLVFLLEWLHNDLKKASEIYSDTMSIARKQWLKELGNAESVISDLFIGQSKSSIICNVCYHSSVTYETFNSLTLSLPTGNRCSLQSCVEKYLTPQKVSGWMCDRCKSPRDATKKFDFIKLPPTVVIHLNRFAEGEGRFEKSETSVEFPLTDFDLGSYLVEDDDCTHTHMKYDFQKMSLYAVSVHSGTMSAGHYMAFCRNVGQKKWYKFDDQLVTEVTTQEVRCQGSSAYLLFYTIEHESSSYIQRVPMTKLGRL